MSSFLNFASIPPLGGRSGASSDPRLSKEVDLKLCIRGGGQGVLPLGCLPLWGREGVTLTTTSEDFQTTQKLGFLQSLLLINFSADH